MKRIKKSLVLISVTGVLTGSALAALADTDRGKPFEGVVVEDVVVVEQFPTEVQGGSVAVSDVTGPAMASASRIGSGQAADIAARAMPGKVVATRLDQENGYLIWDASVLGPQGKITQLKLDAGNGRLLAIESGDREHHEGDDEEHHSSWKFWERDDRDDEEHHSSWKFWERGEHEEHNERG